MVIQWYLPIPTPSDTTTPPIRPIFFFTYVLHYISYVAITTSPWFRLTDRFWGSDATFFKSFQRVWQSVFVRIALLLAGNPQTAHDLGNLDARESLESDYVKARNSVSASRRSSRGSQDEGSPLLHLILFNSKTLTKFTIIFTQSVECNISDKF